MPTASSDFFIGPLEFRSLAIVLVAEDLHGNKIMVGSHDVTFSRIESNFDRVSIRDLDSRYDRNVYHMINFRMEAEMKSLQLVGTAQPVETTSIPHGIYLPNGSFRALPPPEE